MVKIKEQGLVTDQPGRTGIVIETILGNKVQLFIDNIEELVFHRSAEIVFIYTRFQYYICKMDEESFERLQGLTQTKKRM